MGFVVSFIYSLVHRLWIDAENVALAAAQFYLHQASALVMSVGLLLLYGGLFKEPLDPILAASSFGVLGGALLMVYLVIKFPKASSS